MMGFALERRENTLLRFPVAMGINREISRFDLSPFRGQFRVSSVREKKLVRPLSSRSKKQTEVSRRSKPFARHRTLERRECSKRRRLKCLANGRFIRSIFVRGEGGLSLLSTNVCTRFARNSASKCPLRVYYTENFFGGGCFVPPNRLQFRSIELNWPSATLSASCRLVVLDLFENKKLDTVAKFRRAISSGERVSKFLIFRCSEFEYRDLLSRWEFVRLNEISRAKTREESNNIV
mgnify:CR=1 FL=1